MWSSSKKKIKKNWAEPIIDRKISQIILKLEPIYVKRFNAYQDKLGSQWLNVILFKNLRKKFSNQLIRNAIGLRLASKICEKQMHLQKNVSEDG